MNQQQLKLTLKSDIVLSGRAASAGGHESLDYIPGANLLGYAASTLYPSLTREEQYLVFHSGKFRFGNGLPTRHTEESYPSPLCWHYAKSEGKYKDDDGLLIKDRIYNLQHTSFEKGKQPKPLKSGYITRSAVVIEPRKQFRMKTAINENTGRASEAQLFGYECLNQGQVFISTVSADNDVPPELFDKVLESITGEIHIGRSRSAEYGRVHIKKFNTEHQTKNRIETSNTLSLWCLSDMALQTVDGMPLMTPRCASDLGLPKGPLILQKSFIRTRSYAPFNTKYGRHDMERQVIVAGSVLYFEFEQKLEKKHQALLNRGVGLFRQSGLGRVWANSPLLDTAKPDDSFIEKKSIASTSAVLLTPGHPLAQWLVLRAKGHTDTQNSRQLGLQWANELIDMYRIARRLAGSPSGVMVGPSSSQWGTILSAAKKTENKALLQLIFHEKHSLCNHENWAIPTYQGDKSITFSAWLKDKLTNIDTPRSASVVSALCHKIKSYLDKQEVKQ